MWLCNFEKYVVTKMRRAFTSFCTNERSRASPCLPTFLGGRKNKNFLQLTSVSVRYMSNTVQYNLSCHVLCHPTFISSTPPVPNLDSTSHSK